MSAQTKIEWCDSTFNPWEGCQKVGPGCDNCYAENRNARLAGGTAINWGPGAPRRRTSISNWQKPAKWEREHAAFFAEHGRRRRVFCASLADVFDNAVEREWRDDLATLILNCPNLDWLLLTKRIGNAGEMLGEMFLDGTPDNVLIGATVVTQEEADRDIPKLLKVPARVRFLSIEPMLGAIDIRWAVSRNVLDIGAGFLERGYFSPGLETIRRIGWVICGGESGPNARPMHPNWALSLRDQCAAAGVPFLFKQWGEWAPVDDGAACRVCGCTEHNPCDDGDDGCWWIEPDLCSACSDGHPSDGAPAAPLLARVGKKAAGRLLDGVEHNGFPRGL